MAIVTLSDGLVAGVIRGGMRCFLGIPYAAPPVGPRRWMPPQPPEPWREPRDAGRFGGTCAQPDIPAAGGFSAPSDTEDCLFVNVFAPETPTDAPRPVIVLFPGGGWTVGSGNEYDPGFFVRDGNVVFVTLNYRLGLLGFFSHPAINAEGHGGNFGYLDQQQALRWVRDNIAAFGGDPGNVTIAGESAGGGGVLAHLASPGSQGLFHRAIVQSMYPFNGLTLGAAEPIGLAFGEAAGCSDQSAAALRALPVEKILALNSPYTDGPQGVLTPGSNGRFNVGPLTDGVVLPIGILDALEAGAIAKVPLLTGTTHDEGTWFIALLEMLSGRSIDQAAYPHVLRNNFGEAADDVAARYPPDAFDSPGQALAAAVGDATFVRGCRNGARLASRHGRCVYLYEFDVPDGPMPYPPYAFPLRSHHTGELPFLFDSWHGASGTPQALTPDQARLSRQMVAYWTGFARTGDPNVGGGERRPRWDVYSSERDSYLSLTVAGPAMREAFGAAHNGDMWDAVSP